MNSTLLLTAFSWAQSVPTLMGIDVVWAATMLAAVGVGTETDGSIICPAAVSGLAGLKPTVGLVSRRGVFPLSSRTWARTIH